MDASQGLASSLGRAEWQQADTTHEELNQDHGYVISQEKAAKANSQKEITWILRSWVWIDVKRTSATTLIGVTFRGITDGGV
ncbi:hypothetical protein MGYG_05459 [Nannizzia gypsea CBS 118893]|uniref:Uncharacterized protein n=1 Tax=Arthroderma gypseum (strain ATCC MYA-4604 / CBS 118893) TaxID=535722 RepID=E4UW18_ARTGP|nr:hypothetical protein MGYG_05459 [Nannizzia gypsea CBS 118893]EFR02466.1 hypothetical protein MGYG_05459 [Nannizzia gypsea CBS 118893]